MPNCAAVNCANGANNGYKVHEKNENENRLFGMAAMHAGFT